jgi:type VI secretion system protein ImpA
MGNTWPVSLEKLIAPISTENPVGESLRYEGLYDQIREARREDDPNLPQGVWQAELKQADWNAINDMCYEALQTRSKDLQIAAWLLEAWLQLHGIAGIEAGLALLNELCARFWDIIHPQIDGDNLGSRLSPFRWMNEKLYLKFKQIPCTQPCTDDAPVYNWVDWENSLRLESLVQHGDRIPDTQGDEPFTPARFRESVMLSPTPFYVALEGELGQAIEAAEALEQYLEAKCGQGAISLAQFKRELRDMQDKVSNVLAERDSERQSERQDEGQPANLPVAQNLAIKNREQAYQMMAEIADYLIRIEPHSPTPYLVKRAVSWGSMSLTDLLVELVQSESDRKSIFALLGVSKGGDR